MDEHITRTSNRVIESKLGKMASLVRRVKNLIVENGEVKGQAETDRVSRGEVGLGNLGCALVGGKRRVGSTLTAVTNGELGKVTVVVTLPV